MTGTPFSIVVVTWNSAGELPLLQRSAERHLSGPYEFVFVDNGSQDSTLETLARGTRPDDRVIALGENRGFGAAANVGVREAGRGVVILLNPDCALIDSSLTQLAELAARTGRLCGARLLNEDRSWQISAWAPPGSAACVLLALWPGGAMPRPLRRRCDPWRVDERSHVGWLSAACLAAKRDVLLSLGPFDPRMSHYGEDTDLGIRARVRGVPSIFAPDVARVVHLGGRSAVRGFSDRGIRRQVEARRWVASERLGRLRGAIDFGALIVLHLNRWLVKSALRRDATADRAYLSAALASLRSGRRRPPSPL
jgi:N-acetylglucosaminyl-diphospho-decaprenol L-rhamnosyltransferase